MNSANNNQAVGGGWNDEEIEIDVEGMGADIDLNMEEKPKEEDGLKMAEVGKEEGGFGVELDFLDTLVKDSSAQSVGSASRDDQVSSESPTPQGPSPDKGQGYDAVGSLFSYFTSGVRQVAEQAGVTTRQQAQSTSQGPNASVSKA